MGLRDKGALGLRLVGLNLIPGAHKKVKGENDSTELSAGLSCFSKPCHAHIHTYTHTH